MIKRIVRFFDRLEDKIRGKLSHYPILYAFIGGFGVVLFWRGVWHTTDSFSYYFLAPHTNVLDLTTHEIIDGPLSLIVGTIILLMTGIFVSAFVGNKLIISGLVGEKKLTEKQEEEIETEEDQIRNLQKTLHRLEEKLDHIDNDLENGK